MSTVPPPGPPSGTPPTPYPPPRVRQEKGEEKEEEKQREKDEKQHEEKWRRDPLGAIAWACILIWAGLVLLANNLGMLPAIPGLPIKEWSWIFAGAGLILILEVLVRLIMPEHRRGVIGNLIFAFVCLGIGLGDTFGWNAIWGLLLVAVGAAMLIGGILRR